MSSRPLRPCAVPLCPNLTREKYCEQHAHKKEQEEAARHRYYDEHIRDKRAAEFYHSVEWQRLREQALARDHYLCQHCLREKRITRADMVHHINPVRTHWELRLSLSNLVSLCNACHAKMHALTK